MHAIATPSSPLSDPSTTFPPPLSSHQYSPWSLDIEQNGVLATCKELGIPIVAYSPLGRGFLTGSIRSRSDLPPNDMRLHFDRFSEENFPKNLELVDQFATIARKKGVESSQLALAWLRAQDPDLILPIPGSVSG